MRGIRRVRILPLTCAVRRPLTPRAPNGNFMEMKTASLFVVLGIAICRKICYKKRECPHGVRAMRVPRNLLHMSVKLERSGCVADLWTSSISSMTSNSLRMMERSLDFLWAKQAAHLDNVANAETPGYKVKTVTFEERFRTKLREARAQSVRLNTSPRAEYRKAIEKASWSVLEDNEITRMDENGVNVTEQSLEAIRTAYQMQYALQAISSDLSTLRAAITG